MSVRVVVRATEELDAGTRAQVVSVCVAAHDEQDFERLFSYVPVGGRHFLGYHGVELVSHAVITTRWLRTAGERRLRTAYVDAVATLPTHQRHGHGTAVLRMLAQSVAEYDICCLQSDRPSFYERLGWEQWRGPLGAVGSLGVTATPDQRGIMILRLPRTPELDLDSRLLVESEGGRTW